MSTGYPHSAIVSSNCSPDCKSPSVRLYSPTTRRVSRTPICAAVSSRLACSNPGRSDRKNASSAIVCSRASISASLRSCTSVPSRPSTRPVLIRHTPGCNVLYSPIPFRGAGNRPSSRARATIAAYGRKSSG